jgi:hypothetical protein
MRLFAIASQGLGESRIRAGALGRDIFRHAFVQRALDRGCEVSALLPKSGDAQRRRRCLLSATTGH